MNDILSTITVRYTMLHLYKLFQNCSAAEKNFFSFNTFCILIIVTLFWILVLLLSKKTSDLRYQILKRCLSNGISIKYFNPTQRSFEIRKNRGCLNVHHPINTQATVYCRKGGFKCNCNRRNGGAQCSYWLILRPVEVIKPARRGTGNRSE